jgi:chromosome segregation ATPase
MAGQVVELLDRLEEILKQSLPEDKAREAKRIIAELSQEVSKETLEREIPRLEEDFSKRLATKEDLYKVREEVYQVKEELKKEIYRVKEELKGEISLVKNDINKIEKELLTLKILLWVVVILTGASFFPQLLNLLKFLK